MNIGIIVYSQTGNTLSVAQRLKDALGAKGHKAEIEQITTEGEVSPATPVTLKSKPDPSKFDALVFAAPVMGFSLNPAMKAYLPQIKELKGKKAGCFTTQHLPFNWMGGKKAVNTMTSMLRAKGAQVCGSGIVHWKNEGKREKQAAEAVSTLCGIF